MLPRKDDGIIHLPLDKMATILQTIFSNVLVNETFCILIEISLWFILNGPIDNNPALV